MRAPIICVVTDRRRLQDEGEPRARDEACVRLARDAAAAGVDLIQLREPDLAGRALFDLTVRVRDAIRGTPTRLLVNDRLDVALAACVDGVHLRADSIDAPRLRAMTPPAFLVGRSVHSSAEARDVAARGGVDYLVFGTVFPSRSKPGGASAGLDALEEVVRAVRLPVLAIGGVTWERVADVARTGAAGFAAIDLFALPYRKARATSGALSVLIAAARQQFAAR